MTGSKRHRLPDEVPSCAHCGEFSRRTTGEEIYPHRTDLHSKVFFKCGSCDAYVGAHSDTGAALGRPANKELRDARIVLHNRMVDPLWQKAPETGGYTPEDDNARKLIQRAARHRVYAFLAHQMKLPKEQTHVAEFDLEQCRDAWRALRGRTYPEIRDWWKARNPKPKKEKTHGRSIDA